MRRLALVVVLLWIAVGAGADETPVTPAAEKLTAEEPPALDLQQLQKVLGEFESSLYRTEQEKLAVRISEHVQPHAEELLKQLEAAEKPSLEIIRLLGFARNPEASKALIGLLPSPDASVRSAAVFAMGVAGDKDAVTHVAKLLDDKDAKVACQAAVALGRIGDKVSYDALAAGLKSKDALRRLAAIRGLGLLRDERAVGRLEEHLAQTDDPLEMTAALDALNLIAGDDVFRIIAELERVAAALEKHGTGRLTQLAQAAITEALERMIDEAERSQGQQGGSGQGQQRQTSRGQQPGQASGSASGSSQGGSSPRPDSNAGDVAATDSAFADIGRTAGVVWGNLPPAVQEEITAALKQELPERYKHLLRIYYKVLAEGK